ncbi:MAG: hypothetical protein WAM66_10990 [Acidobacteriaceae bacterium]
MPLTPMIIRRLTVAFILAACFLLDQVSTSAQSQGRVQSSPADTLRAVHNALFSSFIPVDELKQMPQIDALLARSGDRIWSTQDHVPAFLSLLAPFRQPAQLRLDLRHRPGTEAKPRVLLRRAN